MMLTCDRCARPAADPSVLKVRSGPLSRRYSTIDICDHCSVALEAFLEEPEADDPGSRARRNPFPTKPARPFVPGLLT